MAKEIPFVSDKLMEQVEQIFAHGPRRAKSHDQRFGQWLINKIRSSDKWKAAYDDAATKGSEKALIEMILWNMENPEMYEMIGDYNK